MRNDASAEGCMIEPGDLVRYTKFSMCLRVLRPSSAGPLAQIVESAEPLQWYSEFAKRPLIVASSLDFRTLVAVIAESAGVSVGRVMDREDDYLAVIEKGIRQREKAKKGTGPNPTLVDRHMTP